MPHARTIRFLTSFIGTALSTRVFTTTLMASSIRSRAPLSFHVPAQLVDTPFALRGQAAIKFNSFWTIELEPGWSLFATHPVNRDDLRL